MIKIDSVCTSFKRFMALLRRSRIFFLLLLIVALVAFFPAFAPLPDISTSSHFQMTEVKTPRFQIYNDMFWKDNDSFQIIGGDVHYFRVLPQYWEDRLLRAKALGLNTIQTYVPWNLHEPRPGQWVFEGIADIESFLKLAHKLGFLVMLRAGPYICAEWDFGGFPAWLLAHEPPLRLRSSDPSFLILVEQWWGILLPKIALHLYSNGGPIVMVQIENEYGSYGDDKVYLQHLVAVARRHLGDNVILYTTDGGTREALDKGTVLGADVFAAVDFSTGDNPWPIFELQKQYNAPGRSPPLSAEFYTGWLTHWREKNQETDAGSTAVALETILSGNASAVLYMAHGGTNYGFFSGANAFQNDSDYKPDITSYDYDSPIKEWGDVDNSKFKALRMVIEKFSRSFLPPIPPNNEKRAYGQVMMQKFASLFEVLDVLCDPTEVVEADQPVAMELLGQVHDRAQIFLACMSDDNRGRPTYVGSIERWSNRDLIIPNIKCVDNVENMGHINYGPFIYDRKGILSDVFMDDIVLRGWKMFPISFDRMHMLLEINPILQTTPQRPAIISSQSFKGYRMSISKEPEFYGGCFLIDPTDQVRDTFLSVSGWNKGIAFVNNHNIGRYWPSVGPQCNLYVPAPILQHGENCLVIMEIDGANPELVLNLVDEPDFTCGSKLTGF